MATREIDDRVRQSLKIRYEKDNESAIAILMQAAQRNDAKVFDKVLDLLLSRAEHIGEMGHALGSSGPKGNLKSILTGLHEAKHDVSMYKLPQLRQ